MRTGLRRRSTVATTVLGLLAAGAFAAEQLSLAEAMARARQDARGVAAAGARAEASQHQAREARAFRLPRVQLQETWIRTDSPADVFGLQLNQERFSFPEFVGGDPNRPEPLEAATTRFELSLPLYAGGELATRERQAKLGAEAAGHQLEWAGHRAALDAAEAWIRLAQARDQVALLEESVAAIERHVALARAYEEQGMLVRSERLRAEVERARLADLLSAARGMEEVAAADLSFRLSAPLDSGWELGPVPAPRDDLAPLETWLATARGRADVEAAQRQVAAVDLEESVRRAARRPRVGLVARRDWVDDTPFGTHGDSTAVMATASIDLFAGGRHAAAAAAARAQAVAARTDLESFEEGVRLEVRQAWIETASALDRFSTAGSALGAAREMERVVEERFRQGVVKTLDLVDAATARREAATRELSARAEAWLAWLRLAERAGRLPESALARGGATEEGR
ncbi:MAG TPA: TolC family protein [Thermoanaerobaculia bacterium]|nr:TolC family protein [Thermoanaerobaculia bacterium]